MRGASDKCAQMLRRIERAGVRRVLKRAKARGRSDPAKDLAIIRRAGLEGYAATGKTFGISASQARSIVERYDAFAQELLEDGEG